MTFKINDNVIYKGTDLAKEPKGSCMFDWAHDHCLQDQVYSVIDVTTNGLDIRIKGKLNPNMPAGKYPDEIWVNAEQFELSH